MLRRHVSGDPDSFGVLFTRHRERLWAVAVRTLADPDEAADALQDAMISAFRQAGSFRGDSAVTTWLHRIVVNACLDRLRRRSARPTSIGLDEEALDALAARPAPLDRGRDSDTVLDVEAALRVLPPDQRAALVLVDMLGYPVAEAAAALGTSVGTVKSRCARGRARLLPHLAHLRTASPIPPPPVAGASAGSPPTGSPTPTPATPADAAARPTPPTSPPPISPAPATPSDAAAGPTPLASSDPGRNRSRAGRVSPGQGGGEDDGGGPR